MNQILIPGNLGKQMMEELVEEHRRFVEEKLISLLNLHNISLDQEGVEFKMINKKLGEGKLMYQLSKDGVVLETFGAELDLDGYVKGR